MAAPTVATLLLCRKRKKAEQEEEEEEDEEEEMQDSEMTEDEDVEAAQGDAYAIPSKFLHALSEYHLHIMSKNS